MHSSVQRAKLECFNITYIIFAHYYYIKPGKPWFPSPQHHNHNHISHCTIISFINLPKQRLRWILKTVVKTVILPPLWLCNVTEATLSSCILTLGAKALFKIKIHLTTFTLLINQHLLGFSWGNTYAMTCMYWLNLSKNSVSEPGLSTVHRLVISDTVVTGRVIPRRLKPSQRNINVIMHSHTTVSNSRLIAS